MALDLGELSARVSVNASGVRTGLAGARREFVAAAQRMRADAKAAGIGEALGDGVTRGADGKLRDARGRFLAEGKRAGSAYSMGLKDKVGKGLSGLGGILGMAGRGFLGLSAVGVGAIGALGAAGAGMGVAVAAGNEQARISFTTMLGSAKEADSFLRDLQKFAATTPFEFPELQQAASSLISSGVAAGDVLPIMKNLGDVTAGMGTGSEGIQRATVALQQMNAAGRITGEDLNQLRDAGIPVYDLLAKATGKTKAEVAELAQKGKLGKKELDAMMASLSNPEGAKGLERFTGLMDKQSASLSGMWSTLKDTLGQGLAGAITPLIPLIKDGLTGASEWLLGVLAKLPDVLQDGVDGVQRFGESKAWATAKRLARGVADGVREVPSLIRRGREALEQFGESDTWEALSGYGKAIGGGLTDYVLPALQWLVDNGVPAVAGFVEKLAEWRNVLEPIGVGLGIVVAGLVAQSAAQSVAAGGGFLKYMRGILSTTRAWTVAQWLLNTAMSLNPLGIVVIALAAVAAGMIYAYKHSDKFRAAVDRLVARVKRNFRNLVEGAKQLGRDIAGNWREMVEGVKQLGRDIRDVFSRLVARVKRNWRNMVDDTKQLGRDIRDLVSGMWRAIVDFFVERGRKIKRNAREMWEDLRDTFVNAAVRINRSVNSMWDKVTGLFSAAWRWIKAWGRRSWDGLKTLLTDPVQAGRNAIRNLFGEGSGLRGIFDRAVKALGKIWDGLKAKMRTPIKGVIDIVNNGIIDSFNWVANKLKLGDKLGIDRISYPKGWREGGPTTSTFSDDQAVGVVHGNEHVATADEVRRGGGHGVWEAARALARQGRLREQLHARMDRLPGYRAGGGVFAGGEHVVSGPQNKHRGYGWARWAGDIPAPTGAPVYAWKDGIINSVRYMTTSYGKHLRAQYGNTEMLIAHLSRILVSGGQRVRAGQKIAEVGNTGNSFGSHAHVEFKGGVGRLISGVSGAIGNAVDMIKTKASWLGKFSNPAEFLKDRAEGALKRLGLGDLGSSGLPGILRELPTKLLPMALDKIKSAPRDTWETITSGVSGAVGWIKDVLTGGKSEQSKNAATIASVASGMGRKAQLAALSTAIVESGLRNVGYGDRDSVGLFQQRAPWGPRSARMDPARSASMFLHGGMGGQRGLDDIPNWRNRSIGEISQAVQVSAFPGRYAQEVGRATAILDSLKKADPRAAGGYTGGGISMLAEGGPELVVNPGYRRVPTGSLVHNSATTKLKLAEGGGSPLVGTLHLVERQSTRDTLHELDWQLRNIKRGGAYNGRGVA